MTKFYAVLGIVVISAIIILTGAVSNQLSGSIQPATSSKPQITGTPMIKLTTTLGTIAIALDFENAPNSAANFQQYCEEGFYEDTIFHRVINGFMVQGGGMTADMSQKETRAPIENEADNGLKNVKGSLAMARTGDPHSATAQFFINVSDNDFLDHSSKTPQGWGYAVFGQVVEGMDVVDAIKAVNTGTQGGHRDVPVEAIVIEKCEITEG